jgi:ferritin
MAKTTNKQTASLKQGSEELLNQQIGMEGSSSALYLSMASWCDYMGYKYAADYLYAQSEEERGHMLKIIRYLNDAGGRAYQPDIRDIQREFVSFRSIFEMALQQEIKTTQSIHRIVQHCWNQQDVATFNFMQWYVQEQIEEEATARRVLDIFDVTGEEGVGRYLIDQAIGALKDK